MKRLFIMATLVGFSLFSSAYAGGAAASPVVLQSFQTAFSGAKEISWKQVGVLYKASFVLNGQYQAAFYNSDGELVALTQNLSSTQLPRALQASLKKEQNGFWISELFAVSIEGEDTYYVKLENAATSLMLKSGGGKKWTVYQTTEK